jgi:cyclophilin family peptidyl-prolyl cis-trans isomerase
LVDKPGRRKKSRRPWGKIAAVVVVVLLVGVTGWYVYENFIYSPPPIYARIDTSDGAITVELFPACAPKTVANFVSLADSGFYNDLVWHRIVDTPTPFVIQTGDNNSRNGLNSTRSTWGYGGTRATVPLEWCGWLHNYEGSLAMAHTSTTTNSGSQFFINLSNSSSNLSLDGNYTVFGKVTSGMDVVQKIAASPICQPPTCPSSWQPDEPLPPVFVNDIVILGTNGTATSTQTTSSG